ncbi:MAG: hypothetical protein GY765_35765 [bacterium]|nr:hypothetical protein [bacterium]
MGKFDLAIGLDATTLNKGVAQLYAKPDARSKLFKGSKTQKVDLLGNVAVNYDFGASPVFTLTPPTDAEWKAATKKQVKKDGKKVDVSKPTDGGFKVVFSKFTASYTIEGGASTPVGGTGEVKVYASVSVNNGQVSFSSAGLWVDESSFNQNTKTIFNVILVPAIFKAADKMLNGISIPSFSFEGIDFIAPQCRIADSKVVIGTLMSTNTGLDITGTTWPKKPLFVLFSADLINAAAGKFTDTLKDYNDSGSGKKSIASYKWSITVNSVTATVDTTNLQDLDAKISATATGSCSLGGCPIGSASASM